jgi:hypothetical protein
MMVFSLGNFFMRISAFCLRPRYIRCTTTCLALSLSKKILHHFRVIIKNPFVTPAVIFLINNRNFHSDVCNGSCSFLHSPHPAGVDVFEQQAPNNHSVHVHVPTPCIDLSFFWIVHPFALNRYCGIAHEFLCLKQATYCLLHSPQ